jgi:RNA polymerase sigma factor (sigma-70 family)
LNSTLPNTSCDEAVFSSLFKKHSKDLFNYLYYKYGANLNPDDRVQEAFVKLWQNCAKVPPKKAKGFLYKVANNNSLNELAHLKVVHKHAPSRAKYTTYEDPQFEMETQEFSEKLQKAIADLSGPQRVAFLLNRIEGKKHKEIAEILGVSTKTVEKRIYGAFKKLKIDIKEL